MTMMTMAGAGGGMHRGSEWCLVDGPVGRAHLQHQQQRYMVTAVDCKDRGNWQESEENYGPLRRAQSMDVYWSSPQLPSQDDLLWQGSIPTRPDLPPHLLGQTPNPDFSWQSPGNA